MLPTVTPLKNMQQKHSNPAHRTEHPNSIERWGADMRRDLYIQVVRIKHSLLYVHNRLSFYLIGYIFYTLITQPHLETRRRHSTGQH